MLVQPDQLLAELALATVADGQTLQPVGLEVLPLAVVFLDKLLPARLHALRLDAHQLVGLALLVLQVDLQRAQALDGGARFVVLVMELHPVLREPLQRRFVLVHRPLPAGEALVALVLADLNLLRPVADAFAQQNLGFAGGLGRGLHFREVLRQDFQPVVDGFPALADLQQGRLNLSDVAVVLLLLFLDEGQRPLDVVDLAGDLGEGVLLDADEIGQAGFFGLAQGQDLFDAANGRQLFADVGQLARRRFVLYAAQPVEFALGLDAPLVVLLDHLDDVVFELQ